MYHIVSVYLVTIVLTNIILHSLSNKDNSTANHQHLRAMVVADVMAHLQYSAPTINFNHHNSHKHAEFQSKKSLKKKKFIFCMTKIWW